MHTLRNYSAITSNLMRSPTEQCRATFLAVFTAARPSRKLTFANFRSWPTSDFGCGTRVIRTPRKMARKHAYSLKKDSNARNSGAVLRRALVYLA